MTCIAAGPDWFCEETTLGSVTMRMQGSRDTPAKCVALSIYEHVLHAVNAETLMREAVRCDERFLFIRDRAIDLSEFASVHVFGAGKASAVMARTLEAIVGSRIAGGVVVTKYGHAEPTERIRLLEAGHPVPDAQSLAAGQAIAQAASALGEHDLALVLLSGGASALVELPVGGVTLKDLQKITDALLRCGATIDELNAVRAAISRIKAGGLARLLAPARVVCLVLSDVLGNPLHVIGSGPCWIGVECVLDPWSVVRRYGLENDIPSSVRRYLVSAQSRASRLPGNLRVEHEIIGDIHTATEAAARAAVTAGHRPFVVTASMRGEAREIGRLLGGVAHDLPTGYESSGLDVLVFAGEPTVTVRGDGRGGRCQELACAAATTVQGVPDVALLAAGTDGTDGPTDAAGALVDGHTLRQAREAGLSVEDALARNDCYPLLDAVNGLVRTGPTGSNVGDVVLIVYASSR